MTIYTDVFTGSSISSPIPYQKINFIFLSSLGNIQLIWPSQSISATYPSNNINNTTNYQVGNITDLLSSDMITKTIYLPDATQQTKGANFSIVNRSFTSVQINIVTYNGTYLLSFINPDDCFTFYLTDNTNQNGWYYIQTGASGTNPFAPKSIPYAVINQTTAGYNTQLYWSDETPPSGNTQVQADLFNIMQLGTISNPGSITLPNPNNGALGYKFQIINSLPNGYTLKVKKYDGSPLITIVSSRDVDYDYYLTLVDNQVTRDWYIESVPRTVLSDYLLPYNSFTLSSAQNNVSLYWANEVPTGTSLIVGDTTLINLTGSINTCTIILPTALKCPIGTTFQLPIKANFTLPSSYQYFIYDYDQTNRVVFSNTPDKTLTNLICTVISNNSNDTLTSNWLIAKNGTLAAIE